MNARQFFDLVTNMRHAQTMYFRTKNAKWLTDAKVLEKRVDDEIQRVHDLLNPKPQYQEGEIF